MKNRVSLVVSIVLMVPTAAIRGNTLRAAENSRQSSRIFSGDSTYLDSFIPAQMLNLNIPGLAACVIKDGQLIWTGAYGYANIAQSIDAHDTTLFMLASISKTVTGTAVMQLWEQGLFDLDDHINDYLPFTVIHPLYPDSAITFLMLLTHTSGIVDDMGILAQSFCWGGDSPMPLDTFLYNYLTQGGYYYSPTNFSTWIPGNGYSYCNVAAALVGYLVEVISDSFPIFCSDSIFTPLGMNETSWFLANLDTSNVAIPYAYSGGQYVPYGHWGHPMYPAFQLRTNTLQLACFLTAFMQYGGIDTVRILDSTTVELMTTVYDPVIAPNQGLFWKKRSLGGRLLWGHSGGSLGVKTDMWYYRDENSGVIILTNGEPSSLAIILHELFEYAAQHGIAENEITPVTIVNLQVSPNPFRSKVNIQFSIEHEVDNVDLRIHDATGRLVRRWDYPTIRLPNHISWNGRDNSSRKLPSGVYFLKLTAGDYIATEKLLLIR